MVEYSLPYHVLQNFTFLGHDEHPNSFFTSVLRTTIAIWERLIRHYYIVKIKKTVYHFLEIRLWRPFFVLCRHTPWAIRRGRIRALPLRTVPRQSTGGSPPCGPTCCYPGTEKRIKNRKKFFLRPLHAVPVPSEKFFG